MQVVSGFEATLPGFHVNLVEVVDVAGFQVHIAADSLVDPFLSTSSNFDEGVWAQLETCLVDSLDVIWNCGDLLDITLENKSVIGKKIGDISPNENFIIVAVFDNGNINIPKPEMVLTKGMKVSILVKTKFAKDIMKRFTKL